MRTCRVCQVPKPLEQFRKQRDKPEGFDTICKVCYRVRNNSYNKDYRATVKGYVQNTWTRMNYRIKHQASYADIQVLFTRDQFFDWAIPAYTDWINKNPGKAPSLDRTDPSGDYAPGNVRVLELSVNCALPKRHKTERDLARSVLRLCTRHQLEPTTVANLLLRMSKIKK